MRAPTWLRRGPALLAAILSSALVLTACGGGGDPAADGDATLNPGAGAFPVTIDTAYGEIAIDEKPQRIVVLDSTDTGLLLSLGVTPVAYSAGAQNPNLQTLLPWLDGYFDKNDPALTTTEGPAVPEAIAAHQPDLIIGSPWPVNSEQLYEQLSRIAPTYVDRERGTYSSWEDRLKDIGMLTGNTEMADQVIADTEKLIADSAERLPGLQGKTYGLTLVSDDQIFWNDGRLLDSLGLKPAENQPVDFSGSVTPLSLERVDELQADVLVIGGDGARETLEADPRFAQLPASQNKTVVYLDLAYLIAMTAPGPMSLPWLLDTLVPLLEDTPLNKSEM